MRRRNFRKKPAVDKNATEEKKLDGKEEAAAKPRANKSKPSKKKSLLSFDEDEEPVVTVVKKTSEPRHIKRKGLSTTAQPKQSGSTQMPSAGEYTLERLKELQKSTPQMPSSQKKKSDGKKGQGVGNTMIKLSGTFKPKQGLKDDRFDTSTQAIKDESPKKELDRIDLPPPPGPPPSKTRQKNEQKEIKCENNDAKNEVQDTMEVDDDETFVPPDRETIRLAKAKRERLRQARLAPDYLPLGGASNLLSQDFKEKERLKGSESEEDREDDVRIAFVAQAPSSKMKRHGLDAHGDSGSGKDDVDDDDDEFVKAQIRKGVASRGTDATVKPAQGQAYRSQSQAGPPSLPVASVAEITARGDSVIQNLQRDLERVTFSKKQAEQDLNRTKVSLRDALEDVNNIKRDLESAGEKYRDVQEMKAYIADLCECLQSKSALIEELEEHMRTRIQERAEEKAKRRKVTDEEDARVAEASVAAALEVFSQGGSLSLASEAAQKATVEAERKLVEGSGPTEVDEFGRNLNLMHKRQAGQRVEKRKVRWEKARRSVRSCDYQLDESSDESDGEDERFESHCSEVSQEASTVFLDADPEYGSLPHVKKRFEGWKSKHPNVYRDAYLSVSMPALFAPFVRLEMLGWCPLYRNKVGFENCSWYRELENYGQNFGENGGGGLNDEDANLVPELVTKIVLPLVVHLVKRCWSPWSFRQSRMLAETMRDMLVYIPAENPALHEIILFIKSQLTCAVDSARIPAWPQAAVNVSEAAESCIGSKFTKALKVLGSVCCFDDILAPSVVREMALGTLVGRNLLGYLRAGGGDFVCGVRRVQMVMQMMPKEWFEAGVPPEGKPFIEVLVSLARLAENQRVTVLRQAQTDVMQNTAVLAELLKKMGQIDIADKLKTSFGITL